jgi:fumarate reductase subunit D
MLGELHRIHRRPARSHPLAQDALFSAGALLFTLLVVVMLLLVVFQTPAR